MLIVLAERDGHPAFDFRTTTVQLLLCGVACLLASNTVLLFIAFHLCYGVHAISDRDSCPTSKCSTNTPSCSSYTFSVSADAAMAMLPPSAFVEMQRDLKQGKDS